MTRYHAILLIVGFIFIKLGLTPVTVTHSIDLPKIESTPVPTFEDVVDYDDVDFQNVPVLTTVRPGGRECLARNIYFEAKNQSIKGQIAVGIVTLKRVQHSKFPDSICGVVQHTRHRHADGFPVRNMCQFSWYCDGKSDRPVDTEAYETAVRVADALLDPENSIVDFTYGADHYHANYIAPPDWTARMQRVAQVEDHIFYSDSTPL